MGANIKHISPTERCGSSKNLSYVRDCKCWDFVFFNTSLNDISNLFICILFSWDNNWLSWGGLGENLFNSFDVGYFNGIWFGVKDYWNLVLFSTFLSNDCIWATSWSLSRLYGFYFFSFHWDLLLKLSEHRSKFDILLCNGLYVICKDHSSPSLSLGCLKDNRLGLSYFRRWLNKLEFICSPGVYNYESSLCLSSCSVNNCEFDCIWWDLFNISCGGFC